MKTQELGSMFTGNATAISDAQKVVSQMGSGHTGTKDQDDASKELQAPVTRTAKVPENKPDAVPPAIPAKLMEAGLADCFSKPKKAFIAAGGTEIQFAREVNFAMQALMNNDYLISCAKNNPEFLIEAIKNVALTGLSLNPELRHGYLVPYKGKIFFRASYMGKCEILMRAGVVKWIEANLVYDKDHFEVKKGSVSEIVHKPDYFSTERGKIKGGYWVAVLPNGDTVFDVMPVSRIEEIKARSEAVKSGKGSPWETDYEEMAKKRL